MSPLTNSLANQLGIQNEVGRKRFHNWCICSAKLLISYTAISIIFNHTSFGVYLSCTVLPHSVCTDSELVVKMKIIAKVVILGKILKDAWNKID